MNREYEYDIKIGKLIPPIGELRYFAKVSFLVEHAASAGPRTLTPPGGEFYGPDQLTVRAKADAAMETWINAQNNL